MVKKIRVVVLGWVAMAVAAVTVHVSSNDAPVLSTLNLENVEALAQGEVSIPYLCAGTPKLCYDAYYHEMFDGVKLR